MHRYYVGRYAKKGGVRELHRSDCPFLPGPRNRLSMGNHRRVEHALVYARERFPVVHRCSFCCPDPPSGGPGPAPGIQSQPY